MKKSERTKKGLKVLFSALILVPMIFLASCGITQYYTITTISSSEATIGQASGGSDVAKAEGTAVTLTATELAPETNPFICWIKDNSKIVSFERVYSTTYSAETEGNYTALFEKSRLSAMRYATITDITVTDQNGANINGNIQIQYAYSTSSSVWHSLENLALENGSAETDKTNLVYFGSASGQSTQSVFIFNAILEQTAGQSTTTYTVAFNNRLIDATPGENQVTFNENGQCTLTASASNNSGGTITISITLSKINSALYQTEA